MTRASAPLVAGGLLAMLGLGAAVLTTLNLVPGLAAVRLPETAPQIERLVFWYSSLPRLAISLLVGAALGLAGVILQQVLRNPIAAPTTLGLSAGAGLALTLVTLFAPGLLAFGREWVAFAGSALAAAVVLALGARRGFSPVAVVLAGLVVSLYCGALSALFLLVSERYLPSLFIWGAGSLQQQDWHAPVRMAIALGVFGLASLAMARPLGLLSLSDEHVEGLGLKVGFVRWIGVALALGLVAAATSAVGVIGFIGLLAPTLARLAGLRRFGSRLAAAPLFGACLLWLTDQAVQSVPGPIAGFVPTGAVTALIGAPLLLFLLPRLRTVERPAAKDGGAPSRPQGPVTTRLLLLVIALLGLTLIATLLGRLPDGGFAFLSGDVFELLLPWRWPRVLGAMGAGALLAIAGLILQRLTANEMASPEVLGVSAGATIGLGVSLFLAATPGLPLQLVCAGFGAVGVLLLVMALGHRGGFAPEHILLAGISLNALLDAGVGLLSATGDPRALKLLSWVAGSTYGMTGPTALTALGLAILFAILTALTVRWLDLLPLGERVASGLGVRVHRVRFILFALAIAATAAGTLVLGPLSFIGLLAPHVARELGFKRALPQLIGALLVGAALMVSADWLGRSLAFPYQLPAGLLSALVGAPVFLLLLARRR